MRSAQGAGVRPGPPGVVCRSIGRQTPLGRVGIPEDIAGPVVFFAGDDSAWCTGALLVVDGGVSVNLQ